MKDYVMVFTCPLCPDVAQLPKPPIQAPKKKNVQRFMRYAALLLRKVFLA